MIEQDDVVPMLLEACPSFTKACEDTLREYGDLLYIVAGEFAHHLLELQRAGDQDALSASGAAIERLHLEGNPFVQELATIGVLEGIQNVWSNNSVDPELFTPHLGAESRRWWGSLKRFWNAEIRYVGDDLHNG
jgi:hypothetical protein